MPTVQVGTLTDGIITFPTPFVPECKTLPKSSVSWHLSPHTPYLSTPITPEPLLPLTLNFTTPVMCTLNLNCRQPSRFKDVCNCRRTREESMCLPPYRHR